MANPPALSAVLLGILDTVRPRVTQRVFAALIRHMGRDGTVPLSRKEIAAAAGAHHTSVTTALGELDRLGALTRDRDPRGDLVVRVNPRLATKLRAAERVQAQAEAPPVAA